MFKNLHTLRPTNTRGKIIQIITHDLPSGVMPLEVKYDNMCNYLFVNYPIQLAGNTRSFKYECHRDYSIFIPRGGCQTIPDGKIYFVMVGTEYSTESPYTPYLTIQSTTPLFPENTSADYVCTYAMVEDAMSSAPYVRVTGTTRFVYVALVYDDIHEQFKYEKYEKLVQNTTTYLDSMADGVVVVSGAAELLSGMVQGFQVNKATYPYGTISIQAPDAILEAIDVAQFFTTERADNVLSIQKTQLLKEISCRAQDQDIAQQIAAIITQNALLRGVVKTKSTDTYYSTIKTAADAALWTIEEL